MSNDSNSRLRRLWKDPYISLLGKVRCTIGWHTYPKYWTGISTHRPVPGYWDRCIRCDHNRRGGAE